MKEILLINPTQSRGGKRKERKQMAAKSQPKKTQKKRKKRSTTTTTTTTHRKTTRSNPKKKRRRRNPQSPKRAAVNLFNARSLMGIFCDSLQQFGGFLACQFSAKKFASAGGFLEDWSWKNYLAGFVGTAIASYGADIIKRGSGRQFMTGGINHLYKMALINELAPKIPWIATYFGDNANSSSSPYFLGTDGKYYTAGDRYFADDGEVYVAGADGMWRPTSDDYRNPDMMGDSLVPQGRLGDSLVPQGRLGDAYAPYRGYFNKGLSVSSDPYARAYLS